METVALVVAILSMLIAGTAAYISSPYSRREKRREERAVEAERRAEAAELREVERSGRELAAERSSRSARPSSQLLDSNGRQFTIRVINVGRSAWWDMKPSFIDQQGNEVSEGFAPMYLSALAHGQSEEFNLSLKQAVAGPIYLRYEWQDDSGCNEYVSHETIRYSDTS
jgi:hypothetical protein